MREIASALLHSPDKLSETAIPGYPVPIVDHAIERSERKKPIARLQKVHKELSHEWKMVVTLTVFYNRIFFEA